MDNAWPKLPAGSGLFIDRDKIQQPRIRWGFPSLFLRILVIGMEIFLLLIWIAVPVACLQSLLRPGGPLVGPWGAFVQGSWAAMTCTWLVLGLLGILAVISKFYPGQPGSIVLAEAWLHYHPGGNGPPLQFDRWAIRDIRLEYGVVSKQLLIETHSGPTEICNSLSESDREWLVAALRTWAPSSRDTQIDPNGNDGSRV